MKNKKLLYVLLPITLGIWITIFVKIYNSLYPAESRISPVYEQKEELSQQLTSDTFSIQNHYRDPFLGKSEPGLKKHGEVISASLVKPSEKPVTASWPNIQYSGLIKNQQSKKQLVLLEINGSLKTVQSGGIIDNIQICRVYKDSIEVKFNKQKRFIRKVQ
jgi:hypothetical protein